MNILTKKQHWSGLFFRPCPDIQAIEISEKLSFPVLQLSFMKITEFCWKTWNWVFWIQELSFSILLKKNQAWYNGRSTLRELPYEPSS